MAKPRNLLSKRELVRSVSIRTSICQKDVERVIDATFSILADAIKEGFSFIVKEFGVFGVSRYKEQRFLPKHGKNKGQELILPARAVPHFYPARRYSERVRKAFAERGDTGED